MSLLTKLEWLVSETKPFRVTGMLKTARLTKYTRYVLIVLVLGILIGLAWWYFFLRSEGNALRASDIRRGVGSELPSFGGTVGSTYGNIVANLSSFIGGGENREDAAQPRLQRPSEAPVAGLGFVSGTSRSSATTTLPFVERGTGHVLVADVETGQLTRLTNTLVPRVYEALVAPNGITILRGVDENGVLVTSAGIARASSTPNGSEPAALSLRALPQNILSIALSPSGNEIVYILRDTSGASVMRAKWDGTNAKRVTRVGVSGWNIQWLGDGRIILTQKPTSAGASYAYELSSSGQFLPILSGGSELAVLPKTGSKALAWSTGLMLSARLDANTSAIILPVRTRADKCVWAPGKEHVLYCAVPQSLANFDVERRARGELYTSDAWWKIDVSANDAELLYDFDSSVQVDVTKPIIDGSGNYLAFMNASDKSAWVLRIDK